MPSFFEPPRDYAPPADWVDPATVEPEPRPEVEVGDLLKRRAEEAKRASEAVPGTVTPEDCAPCLKARARARLIGLTLGAVLGVAISGIVYLRVQRAS
ncbi:MAG: hypothetical protein M0020_03540 [Actinomycetota bacterium]|nr:hypothetical protein [Actinomycetota bacterium]